MEHASPAHDGADTILFRPSKKRKIYRQRALDDDPNTTSLLPAAVKSANPAPTTVVADDVSREEEDLESTQVPISEIQRLRRLHKHRVGGVEFRATSSTFRGDDTQESALMPRGEGGTEGSVDGVQPAGGVVRRFAKQTGMLGDVDKHMMAYVDSELNKRRLNAMSSAAAGRSGITSTSGPDSGSTDTAKAAKPVERQPATLGKILEVDLGNEARDRNVVRTEQARRRLDGEDVEDESASEGKTKRVRLGRDGKPWRGRKRRTSEDIRRDQLVEEVLRENRLEMYEEPQQPAISTQGDGEADDRIAEAFRREFMDAVSERQRKKPAPPAPTRSAGGKKEEELLLKGPKLGGSRSARAAMREAQLKELKAGKR